MPTRLLRLLVFGDGKAKLVAHMVAHHGPELLASELRLPALTVIMDCAAYEARKHRDIQEHQEPVHPFCTTPLKQNIQQGGERAGLGRTQCKEHKRLQTVQHLYAVWLEINVKHEVHGQEHQRLECLVTSTGYDESARGECQLRHVRVPT